jgi:hypothetical protein
LMSHQADPAHTRNFIFYWRTAVCSILQHYFGSWEDDE